MLNVKVLGQVFTPKNIVLKLLSLRKNLGNVLEPSAGDGAFANEIKNIIAIEYDKNFAIKNNFINIDFFNYSITNKFDTIIGNPPYVKYNSIDNNTIKLIEENYNNGLFDKRTNLYMFFIYKSILHLKSNGELIFITPKDFLKATSCIKLNEFIYKNGTITDFIDLGDKKVFKNASPNTIIWRFEKDNFSRITNNNLNFLCQNGQILFQKNINNVLFSDIAFIKVGAVSGITKIFEHKEGINFVCSYTNKTGQYKKLIYNKYHIDLEKHKEKLLKRQCKKITENNWWEWGRKFYESDLPRVYVNCRTRNKNPFFYSDVNAYEGSILAIFPKRNLNKNELLNFMKDLNLVDWNDLGFVTNGRFIFNQKSLEQTYLPEKFNKYK